MKGAIGGVIISPYIPFDAKGQVQNDALGEHIDFLIAAGVNALYCLGTVGEFPSMSTDQRKRVAEMMVDNAAKRVPVVIHVGTNILGETIELARHSQKIGADAVYCVPPYYFRIDDKAIVNWFNKIAGSITIPLHYYNIPSMTKLEASPELMAELGRIPNITAEKDSTDNIAQIHRIIELADLDVFIGKESLYLPGLVAGAAGLVSGRVGPAFPELVVEFYDAFRRRDLEKAKELQRRINALSRVIAGASSMILPAVKATIRLRGLMMGPDLLTPLRPLTKDEIGNLKERLEKMGAI